MSPPSPLRDVERLRQRLCQAQAAIRDAVVAACEAQAQEKEQRHQRGGDALVGADPVREEESMRAADQPELGQQVSRRAFLAREPELRSPDLGGGRDPQEEAGAVSELVGLAPGFALRTFASVRTFVGISLGASSRRATRGSESRIPPVDVRR